MNYFCVNNTKPLKHAFLNTLKLYKVSLPRPIISITLTIVVAIMHRPITY